MTPLDSKSHSEGNIDFNARDDCGWTGFMFACQGGHKDVVQVILEQSGGNVDFNARGTRYGKNAFAVACFFGHKDVVKLLLECAKTKGIRIPSSRSICSYVLKEIRDLIAEYEAKK